MPFLGTIINFICMVLFAFIGAFVKKAIPEKVNRGILCGIAICIIYLGIDGALETSDAALTTFFGNAELTKFIIMIVSLTVGTAIGELIDIDKRITALGAKLEAKLTRGDGDGSFAKGFVSCALMTCVGAMAVYGSILDAAGDPSTLIAKSVIDAITCFIMAASFGIGCAFSAVSVLLYQGAITAVALLAKTALSSLAIFDATVYYLSATGSLILVLIGTNFLGATNVKTANMTPAVFIPLILTPILNLF